MSREVRRVPIDFKHPVRKNPYWREQAVRHVWRSGFDSRLHGPTEQFVGLMDDYPGRLADWEQECRDLAARTGSAWTFQIEYHLTGWRERDNADLVVRPYYVWDEDGENEIPVALRDVDHLHELETTKKASEKPDPADYMPMFDVPADELGWCLYETVSEGTPVTPVFATADELIDHLATVGQDWDQVPLRRAAAEAIVGQGCTFGSAMMVGGVFYDATKDADVLTAALKSHEE